MPRRKVHPVFMIGCAALGLALVWPESPHRGKPVARADASARETAQPAASAPAGSSEDQESLALIPPNTAESRRSAASCGAGRSMLAPSGEPPRLTCAEARAILAEMHARFAGVPRLPPTRDFGELVVGWLDPHGLWSAAPDAPLHAELRQRATALLDEIRRPVESAEECVTAERLGGALESWVAELSRLYEDAAREVKPLSPARAASLATAQVFQDDPVTQPARVLSRRLGEAVTRFARAFPEFGRTSAGLAKARYFPALSAHAWGEAVLAAAVRAYVPLVDPHGDWAPLEEEWSLYADDPGLDGEPRLWREITRTAVGVRVARDAAPPLSEGDLVLTIDGVPTAGMPLEQAEQLARLEPQDGSIRRISAMRRGHTSIEHLNIDFGRNDDPSDQGMVLDTERVRFGEGHALVVRIPEVPDGLGDALARVLSEARVGADRGELSGLLLDLRGNGGGSTDAAAAVVGLFLPGAPLFPLSSHEHLVEVMRALEPSKEDRFSGPLAVLVDGYTASAAEMIAGALSAYRRAPVLGVRTFGKGCIQEYVDDHQGKGVLRVTTLLFALPDGSPVQRTGLLPDITVPAEAARDREADLPQALPTYRGPDVRDRFAITSDGWPSHHGAVGPCSDRSVCRALSRLGAQHGAARLQPGRRLISRASK